MTEETLREHHKAALRLYRRAFERMHGHLSVAEDRGVSEELLSSIEEDAALFPREAKLAALHYRREPYRQKLSLVYRKRQATLWSANHPFTPAGWAYLEKSLDRTYDDFTSKVSAGRGLSSVEVEALARGQVWTGEDALAHGLVDGQPPMRYRDDGARPVGPQAAPELSLGRHIEGTRQVVDYE